MPHTTRKNYKTRLEERREIDGEAHTEAVAQLDEAYTLFKQGGENIVEFRRGMNVLARTAISLVDTMDESRITGNLRFAAIKCDADDLLLRLDGKNIIRRTIDILLAAQERVELLAENLAASERARTALTFKAQSLQLVARQNLHHQYEMYYVGSNPTDTEKLQYNKSVGETGKYSRFGTGYDTDSDDETPETNGH